MSAGTDHREPGVAETAAWLTRATGLRVTEERADRTAQAIHQAMRASGVSGPAYPHLVEQDPAHRQQLIGRVTVGETHFFREARQFDALRHRIVPELLGDRAAPRPLGIWSAACATGEEPYSVAILLDELGLLDRSELLATDIDTEALQRARAARYRPWSLRGVDARRRGAYFRAAGAGFDLDRRLVERVTFRPLNLVGDPYPVPSSGGGWDVILCRNVLIYLTPEAVAEVAGRLATALTAGGWLVTASTDPDLSSVPGLQLVVLPRGVAYRSAAPPSRGAEPAATVPADPGRRRRGRADVPAGPARPVATAGRAHRSIPEAEAAYRCAVSLLEDGRWPQAAIAARNAVYLDPGLVVAHVVLGRAARQLGDTRGAARAWRTARTLLERLDPATPVPLAGGAAAGRLLAELAVTTARSPVAQP